MSDVHMLLPVEAQLLKNLISWSLNIQDSSVQSYITYIISMSNSDVWMPIIQALNCNEYRVWWFIG